MYITVKEIDPDIRELVEESVLATGISTAFDEYNREQFIPVKHPQGHQVDHIEHNIKRSRCKCQCYRWG